MNPGIITLLAFLLVTGFGLVLSIKPVRTFLQEYIKDVSSTEDAAELSLCLSQEEKNNIESATALEILKADELVNVAIQDVKLIFQSYDDRKANRISEVDYIVEAMKKNTALEKQVVLRDLIMIIVESTLAESMNKTATNGNLVNDDNVFKQIESVGVRNFIQKFEQMCDNSSSIKMYEDKVVKEIESIQEFDKLLERSEPVLVKFHAEWCGPCKSFAPSVDKLAENLSGIVTVCSVNIDSFPEIAQRYSVRTIPTMILLRGSKEIMRQVGRDDIMVIEENIRKAIEILI
jgi:thioredoxin 1